MGEICLFLKSSPISYHQSFSANITTWKVSISLGYIKRDPPFASHFSSRSTPQRNFVIIIEVEGLSSQEGENWNQVMSLKTLNLIIFNI